uniref:Uncharacterized protein n=1 Tax=Glossina austeni TaxID=7395 RepID=A0A1A9VEF1_GLOAU
MNLINARLTSILTIKYVTGRTCCDDNDDDNDDDDASVHDDGIVADAVKQFKVTLPGIMDELRPSEQLACDYKCYQHHNLVLSFVSLHLSRLMLSKLKYSPQLNFLFYLTKIKIGIPSRDNKPVLDRKNGLRELPDENI